MPQYDPTQTYTITVPGIQDIIRIPPLESTDLKRERIRRWKAARSPLPQTLDWIPQAINRLDDLQDELITALILGRWLAPRLLGRFLPYVGWALLASDILNVTNAILSTFTGGATSKVNFYRTMLNTLGGRSAAVARAEGFLARDIPWFGFAVQGAQVLRTFTGWGLQLGGIMGMISDATWGSIRAAQGGQLRIIGPPPSDPVSKATQVLSYSSLLPWMAGIYNPTEALIDILGTHAAANIATNDGTATLDQQRLVDLAGLTIPSREIWSQSSIDALQAEGFDLNAPATLPLPFAPNTATYGGAFRAGGGAGGTWEEDLKGTLGDTGAAHAANVITNGTSEMFWDVYAGAGGVTKNLTPFERLVGIAIHKNVWPPWEADSCTPNESLYHNRYTNPWTQCMHVGGWRHTIILGHDPTCRQIGPEVWVCPPGAHQPAQDIYEEIIDYRLPAPYPPPPNSSQNQQLEWWMWLSILLYCGQPIEYPGIADVGSQFPTIIGWTTNTRKYSTDAPYYAALLVWGNAWMKSYQAHTITPQQPTKLCVGNRTTDLPKLFPAGDPREFNLLPIPDKTIFTR